MRQRSKIPWYLWLPYIGAVLYFSVQAKFENDDTELTDRQVDSFYEYHFWLMLAAVIGTILFEIFCIYSKYHFL